MGAGGGAVSEQRVFEGYVRTSFRAQFYVDGPYLRTDSDYTHPKELIQWAMGKRVRVTVEVLE
jgi:hypothetical protein